MVRTAVLPQSWTSTKYIWKVQVFGDDLAWAGTHRGLRRMSFLWMGSAHFNTSSHFMASSGLRKIRANRRWPCSGRRNTQRVCGVFCLVLSLFTLTSSKTRSRRPTPERISSASPATKSSETEQKPQFKGNRESHKLVVRTDLSNKGKNRALAKMLKSVRLFSYLMRFQYFSGFHGGIFRQV